MIENENKKKLHSSSVSHLISSHLALVLAQRLNCPLMLLNTAVLQLQTALLLTSERLSRVYCYDATDH